MVIQGRQDEMVVICIIFQIAGCPGIQISILFDDLFLWGGISWNFRAVLWWWIYYANPSEATNSNVSTVDTPMYQKQIFQCSICTIVKRYQSNELISDTYFEYCKVLHVCLIQNLFLKQDKFVRKQNLLSQNCDMKLVKKKNYPGLRLSSYFS